MSSVSEIAKRLDDLLTQPAPAEKSSLLAKIKQVQLDCVSARQIAEQTLADAVERREAVLMTADDDAILVIDREVNLAAINLERLDRLEPQITERLREFQAGGHGCAQSPSAILMSLHRQEA